MNWFPDYKYVLGSQSPRRQQLLTGLGLPYIVRVTDMPEDYPEGLEMSEIPVYLSRRKAEHLLSQSESGEMLITADTIVWLKDRKSVV